MIAWSRSQYRAVSSVYYLKVFLLGAVTRASWSFGWSVGRSMVILIESSQRKPPASDNVWLNSTRYSAKGREVCLIYLNFYEARSAFWGSLKIPSRYSKSFSCVYSVGESRCCSFHGSTWPAGSGPRRLLV